MRQEIYSEDERHEYQAKMMAKYKANPPTRKAPSPTFTLKIDTLIVPDVLFATNSYNLNEVAHLLLDSLLAQTRKLEIDSLVVEGHTDNQGSANLNQKLSENRAISVATYFNSKISSNIVTRGWASQKPVADNRSAGGRQKNRRVEIYIYVRE